MSNRPTSREELRAARLQALGVEDAPIRSQQVTTDPPPTEAAAALPPPGPGPRLGEPAALPEDDLRRARLLLWGPNALEDDRRRWHRQGFTFCESPAFGLEQGHGGPCGVLAVVQAEILRALLFGETVTAGGSAPTISQYAEISTNQTTAEMQLKLGEALLVILNRVSGGNAISIVTTSHTPCCVDSQNPAQMTPADAFTVVTFSELTDEARAYMASILPQFQADSGTLLFVLSVLQSRGLTTVQEDMDDPSASLIAQFGHCAQELLNLLLCGEATSNVFDGSIPMGDTGLTLRGVPKRASIGYLTQLEALRYCQVGSFYKTPNWPIWVVGSSSHFTVLFGTDAKMVLESNSERMLKHAQRAFKASDPNENGFVDKGQVKQVLAVLMTAERESQCESQQGEATGGRSSVSLLTELANDPAAMSALTAFMETAGAGIVLWDDFWRAVSRLMTGASLESVIGGQPTPVEQPVSQSGNRPRSDSDVARELQAELDGLTDVTPMDVDPGPFSAQQGSSGFKTDAELARELQAELDPSYVIPPLVDQSPSIPQEPDPVAQRQKHIHRHDSFAKEGDESFMMYHYNGLIGARGNARLVRFAMTKRSADDAVGMTVPLSDTQSGGASGSLPIDEVVRTKWQGARTDWLGQEPPSID